MIEQEQRGERGDLHALHEGQKIERIGADEGVVVQRQRAEERRNAMPAGQEIKERRVGRLRQRRLRQADPQHDQERHQKKHQQPGVGNPDDELFRKRSFRGHGVRRDFIWSARWRLRVQSSSRRVRPNRSGARRRGRYWRLLRSRSRRRRGAICRSSARRDSRYRQWCRRRSFRAAVAAAPAARRLERDAHLFRPHREPNRCARLGIDLRGDAQRAGGRAFDAQAVFADDSLRTD